MEQSNEPPGFPKKPGRVAKFYADGAVFAATAIAENRMLFMPFDL